MAKTRHEVANLALEMLGIKAVGEGASAEDAEVARTAYLAYFEELTDADGAAFTFTVDDLPDRMFYPMATAVAGRIAPIFSVAFDGSAGQARLRGIVFEDDRIPGVPSPGVYF